MDEKKPTNLTMMSCDFETDGFTSFKEADYYRKQRVHCPNCNSLLNIMSVTFEN